MSPLQQIVNLIKQSENILVLGHANPDGDAIGSALALTLALRKLDKKVSAASADPVSQMLRFLPELSELETSIAGANDLVVTLPLGDRKDAEVSTRIEDDKLKIFIRPYGQPWDAEDAQIAMGEADYDLIICCDTPDLQQLGKLFEANPNLFYEAPVVNIDHHPSNTGYGKVNLVDTTAASSSELVLRVIQSLEAEAGKKLLDPDIATLILTGIITDTGSFQNANTTPRSFEVSADLIDLGARQQEIIQHVYKTKQLSTLKLWGKVLSKIEFDPTYRIVWSTVTDEDLRLSEASDADATGIIDELMSNAPGAEVVLLIRQKGDLVSVSMRTTTPAVDASEIAGIFGGGGHLQAAGFKIPGKKVELAVDDIIGEIRKYQGERLNIHEDKKNKLQVSSESKKINKFKKLSEEEKTKGKNKTE